MELYRNFVYFSLDAIKLHFRIHSSSHTRKKHIEIHWIGREKNVCRPCLMIGLCKCLLTWIWTRTVHLQADSISFNHRKKLIHKNYHSNLYQKGKKLSKPKILINFLETSIFVFDRTSNNLANDISNETKNNPFIFETGEWMMLHSSRITSNGKWNSRFLIQGKCSVVFMFMHAFSFQHSLHSYLNDGFSHKKICQKKDWCRAQWQLL